MTFDELTMLAAAQYSGEEYGYTDDHERLFALLVDVADAYVAAIRAGMVNEYERAAEGDREPVLGLGPLAGMGAVEIAIQGLRENLEVREKERR